MKVMIKAQELRSQNLVQRQGVIWKVNDIFGASGLITVYPNGNETLGRLPIYEFESIPLTEEWLVKMGLEKVNEVFKEYFLIEYWNYHKTVKSKFKLSLEHFDDYYMGIWIGADSVVHLYYVHQLQNLFYSLCGEELEIKL